MLTILFASVTLHGQVQQINSAVNKSTYLLAFTLVQMVPENQEQILQRADDFAHNRLVCGVHYASDVEASRNIAYVMFGYMLANPRFQKELAAARVETRQHLGLPLTTPHT
jgi:acid phosphatase (class A)